MIRVITKVVLPIILLLVATFLFITRSTSKKMGIEVHKDAFRPDCEELLVDSLMADGVKICSMAQRYYHKSMALGGGGDSFDNFLISSKYHTTNHGTFTAKMSKMQYDLTGTALPGLCDDHEYLIIRFITTPENIMATIDRC